jgi:hypothetical protein
VHQWVGCWRRGPKVSNDVENRAPGCQAKLGTGPVATLRTGPPIEAVVSAGAGRPRSPREGPARSAAPFARQAERSAGGPCGPPGASRVIAGCPVSHGPPNPERSRAAARWR